LEDRWCPSYVLVTSRTALAGTDSVNWGTAGPAGTIVANPFTILSTSARSVSVSKTQVDSFQVLEEMPCCTGTAWAGNFARGDMVLWTHDFGSKSTNPITLNFGTTAVAAGGAQIQEDYFPGDFTAQVQALDASGNVLASFTERGKSTSAEDNSAMFIGISSTSANIFQIALSLTNAHAGTVGDFAINKFDFRTSPLAATPAAAAPAVSQSASMLDQASLAFSLLGTGQRAMPVSPTPGPATPSAPSAGQSGGVQASGASSPAPAWATNVVFAASHLFAKAEDSYGVFGDPFAITLMVQ
jgi:hypothetical protein